MSDKVNVQALERAIAVAEGVEAQVGYDILLAAAKRFVRSQKAGPLDNGVTPTQVVEVPKSLGEQSITEMESQLRRHARIADFMGHTTAQERGTSLAET